MVSECSGPAGGGSAAMPCALARPCRIERGLDSAIPDMSRLSNEMGRPGPMATPRAEAALPRHCRRFVKHNSPSPTLNSPRLLLRKLTSSSI